MFSSCLKSPSPAEATLQIALEMGDLLRAHRAGMARYIQGLLNGLQAFKPQAKLYGWAPWRRMLGWPIKPSDISLKFFSDQPPQHGPDLFHATACVFPSWKSAIEVATVHDLFAVRETGKLTSEFLARHTAYIRRADRIICVSQFTRNHLHSLLPDIPESRTVAIPLAAASWFVPAPLQEQQHLRTRRRLPAEFLLFVGRDRPNKNLDRLITAYAISGLTLPLCIAGAQAPETRLRLAQLAREYQYRGNLRWLGPVSERTLPVLLSSASAVCLPSTFEGFGLPIIEAMACNTPVLTSAGCATEEAAGGHAMLVDPLSVDSIADGLIRVLQMSNPQRVAAGAYARHRTWRDVAAETLREYERVLGEPLMAFDAG